MMPMIPSLLPQMPLVPVVGQPWWLTEQPEIYHLCENQGITLGEVTFRDRYGNIWNVPKGYPTDGMSYPWLLRRLGWYRYDKRTLRDGVLHDFRYSMRDYLEDWKKWDSQKAADTGLLDGLRIDFPSRAWWCYIGVRFGGYSVYEHIAYEFLMEKWLKAVRRGPEALERYMIEVTGQGDGG